MWGKLPFQGCRSHQLAPVGNILQNPVYGPGNITLILLRGEFNFLSLK